MNEYMIIAIKEAIKASKKGEVPVGAVLVCNNKILTKGFNNRRFKYNVTGHAEINVINKACKKSKYWKLDNCDLYVTLKPCKMCMEVIREANIRNVYYLLDPLDIKKNRYLSATNYQKIDDSENVIKYRNILSEFFDKRR